MKKDIINLCKNIKGIGGFLFKYRYYIAVIVFIICILFELSGSSIGIWNQFIKTNQIDDGVIFGQSRSVRSDEWAVLTPMMFSQKFDGFHYFSNLIRGGGTDVSMVYALPIMNFVQIFRPFQIGFLFLGMAKGLSFFWYGRLIALFLVMLELFMLLTKKNKILSVVGAFLITLAPIVQWWFAINGIVEIFVFGGLAIILLDKYMKSQNFKNRCLYLFLLYICAGGYLLVLYPAWQVPMFYVFLAIAIWVIIKNIKECKMNYKDFISIGITILLFIITMGYILYSSFNTIKIVMETAYPGSRAETGGGFLGKYFMYPINIFLPYKEAGLTLNHCKTSTIFGLFPMGIIITLILFLKEKKKDLLLILFLVIYTLLSTWCIFGFPETLAKLTLLSNSQPERTILAVGFLDVLILIRALSLIEKPLNKLASIIIAIIVASILVFLCERQEKQYVTLKMAILMLIMLIYLFYILLRYKSRYINYLSLCSIILIMIINGATVNPIRKGIDNIYNSNIVKKIQEVNNQENGKWIVEELGFPIANYILLAGVPVINSTNVYPDLERWHQVDIDNKYEDIYNRYAHITIKIRNQEEVQEDKFKLLQIDYFEVKLTAEELKKLDVKYIFTNKDLTIYNTDNIKFQQMYNENNYYIYKLLNN